MGASGFCVIPAIMYTKALRGPTTRMQPTASRCSRRLMPTFGAGNSVLREDGNTSSIQSAQPPEQAGVCLWECSCCGSFTRCSTLCRSPRYWQPSSNSCRESQQSSSSAIPVILPPSAIWSCAASLKGIVALALVSLALAGPILTSAYVGFTPLAVFLLAPASAIAQELFFRAGLLPAMHRMFPGRPGAANLAHAALFGLWHVPRAMIFSPINPFLGALMLVEVTGMAGFGWGWQVRHDGTIGWSTLHHWLLLSVMSLFGL